jgi:hypothetical protein
MDNILCTNDNVGNDLIVIGEYVKKDGEKIIAKIGRTVWAGRRADKLTRNKGKKSFNFTQSSNG